MYALKNGKILIAIKDKSGSFNWDLPNTPDLSKFLSLFKFIQASGFNET